MIWIVLGLVGAFIFGAFSWAMDGWSARRFWTVWTLLVIASVTLIFTGCASTATGDNRTAYLTYNTLMCERKLAMKRFVDHRLDGRDGQDAIRGERRMVPGTHYSLPTCHITKSSQFITRLIGEPEPYKSIHLRRVRLRGSIVSYWVFQEQIKWR